MFAAKLMWRQLPDLQVLAGQLPEYQGLELYEMLSGLLRDPRYVWVSRRDKSRQAVSLWRALQTRTWRLEHPRQEDSPEHLRYSFDGIDHLVGSLTAEDQAWSDYFTDHAIEVIKVRYEDDLERDRTGTATTLLRQLGIAPPRDWHAPTVMHRQADALNEEWVAAYRRDVAARASQREPVVLDD